MKTTFIPFGGSAFAVNESCQNIERFGDGGYISEDGVAEWTDNAVRFDIYFRISESAELTLGLHMDAAPDKASVVSCTVNGVSFETKVEAGTNEAVFGKYQISDAGYVKAEIRGVSKDGECFACPDALTVVHDEKMSITGHVKYEDKENYYWTRRGPSVHANYDVSGIDDDIEWFYNEVTVNEGEDPFGTYAMAIGFSGGYFGMQVNSETERKLLFSIWSPFVTDNPDEIPEEKRILLRAKHKNMYTGEFGGEGSGGQSYMNYNWVSGQTYKFLIHICPSNEYPGKTEFTAYFLFPESGKFELLASFLRPETVTYIKGPHSFLESFSDYNGYKFRKAYYGNQWAYTKGGKWHKIDSMVLTADMTGRRDNRSDFGGGAENERFYLCNCGFFNGNAKLDVKYSVKLEGEQLPPQINFDELEK